MKYELRHPDRLYLVNPSCYCGFLVRDKVMRKMQRMTADFESEIRMLLSDNIEDIELYGWNLAHPNGNQETIHMAEPGSKEDKEARIALFKARQPEHKPKVYKCKAHSDEAKAIIKEIEGE